MSEFWIKFWFTYCYHGAYIHKLEMPCERGERHPQSCHDCGNYKSEGNCAFGGKASLTRQIEVQTERQVSDEGKTPIEDIMIGYQLT